MKKRGWISGLWVTTVLLSCLAIASPAPAATAAVKVVELSGAATAAIPITVPPGRAGLQPKLNLTYHSYKKNGWIGVGWDLGMGAITRSTKRGVDYDAFDFVANGQELVPVDIDTAGNGTYQARIEGGFALYEFSHSDGWVMTAKDGTKYYFGQDTASRQDDPDDLNRVFKWCLDKVVDSNGNYMLVSYEKDQGQIYLQRIDYTGNNIVSPSLSTSNTIIFYSKEDRLDQSVSYISNFEIVLAKRLQTIEVQSQDGLVRAYDLRYIKSQGTSRSELAIVQQYGNDADIQDGLIVAGTPFPAYSIEYAAESNGILSSGEYHQPVTTGNYSSANNWQRSLGDVNGDGKIDLIMHYSGGPTTPGIIVRAMLSNKLENGLLSRITTPSYTTTNVEYNSSSTCNNKLIPFVIQLASKITTNDGNGVVSETNYSYAGGLFDYETREFRGFKEAIQTNPDGSTKRTVFYQGDLEDDDPEEQEDQACARVPGTLLTNWTNRLIGMTKGLDYGRNYAERGSLRCARDVAPCNRARY